MADNGTPQESKGRLALVTGGTTGLGRMIAEGLARRGMRVIICARTAEKCTRVAQEIESLGFGSCVGFPVDLAESSGVEKLVRKVEQQSDALHVLVNCAGKPLVAPIEDYPEDGWDQVFDLNIRASFFLVKRLLPMLRRGATDDWQSSVINIGSISGYKVQENENYAYAASKAGLHFLTRSLAKHLGPQGITVNAIAPGFFPTEMTDHYPKDFVQNFIGRTPRRRLGAPRDIADLAAFLASPSAIFLSGAVIPLDGAFAA
ncbi:MAG: SDR family oxidoreductase [Caulobacterales bacterium]